MESYYQEIKKFLGNEKAEAIICDKNRGDYGAINQSEDQTTGLKSLEELKNLLDYEYDSGYGGCDCHPLYIWTKTRVIFCGCYDGATWLMSVPRNPTAEVLPEFCGGG